MRAAPLFHPGVVSATLFGVKYSSSTLDKSYGSNNDGWDPEPVAEGMRLLLGKISSLVTDTLQCLAQYSFSAYFRKASWNGVL